MRRQPLFEVLAMTRSPDPSLFDFQASNLTRVWGQASFFWGFACESHGVWHCGRGINKHPCKASYGSVVDINEPFSLLHRLRLNMPSNATEETTSFLIARQPPEMAAPNTRPQQAGDLTISYFEEHPIAIGAGESAFATSTRGTADSTGDGCTSAWCGIKAWGGRAANR